jgi:hypothetical protein
MEDSSEGKLCQVCTATLQGETRIEEWHRSNDTNVNNRFDRVHHTNYSNFTKSKDEGCCICSWLWANHTPPSATGERGESSTLHDLKIFCRVDEYDGVDVHFCITCCWAAESKLHGIPLGSSVERYGCPKLKIANMLSSLPLSFFGEGPRPRSIQSVQHWRTPSILERPEGPPLVPY